MQQSSVANDNSTPSMFGELTFPMARCLGPLWGIYAMLISGFSSSWDPTIVTLSTIGGFIAGVGLCLVIGFQPEFFTGNSTNLNTKVNHTLGNQ
jgi:hypothetical protein